MNNLSCQIVEDEPLAAELLTDYINQISFLELNGISHSAIDASIILKEKKIDLLFLDLHLPGIKGFDFIRTLKNPPHIIVTTAYPQYALEGYELNIADYLVKPIEFPRFFHAVNKIADLEKLKINPDDSPLYFRANRKKVQIWPKEIYFIESQRDYVNIHLENRIVKSKITLHETFELLSRETFMQVHKSFIVSKNKISSFNTSALTVMGTQIPIGRSFKESVLDQIS